MVNNIHSRATPSTVSISWSPPTTALGSEMLVDQYHVKSIVGPEYSEKQTRETSLELTDIPPMTYVLSTIRSEYQGRVGPAVYIGLSTGKLCNVVSYLRFRAFAL